MKSAASELTALRGAPPLLAFDVARLREDFPILHRSVHGKPLVYLDNAATSQKPQCVIDVQARYYAEHKDMNALTDDLRHNLENVSHTDLRGFFDQWLRRPGFPELAVTWAYDAQRGTILTVRQVGRYGFFVLTLPVVIVDNTGLRRTMKIPVPATGETSAQILPPATRVREVIIDPDVTVLMRLVQPTG